jgi:GNAT superfamily N-acetyltransferase
MGHSSVEVFPLTPDRWSDLDTLFGTHGAGGGCWCMWWRLTDERFRKQAGQTNKRAFKKIVDAGEMPGVLAYVEKQPAGWCSIAPREKFGRLERSPLLKRVDDKPVWSIVCYYVDRLFRGQGLMEHLTRGAIELATDRGAGIIEAYPFEISEDFSASQAYTGTVPLMRGLGFVEIIRRTSDRPIMRYFVEQP